MGQASKKSSMSSIKTARQLKSETTGSGSPVNSFLLPDKGSDHFVPGIHCNYQHTPFPFPSQKLGSDHSQQDRSTLTKVPGLRNLRNGDHALPKSIIHNFDGSRYPSIVVTRHWVQRIDLYFYYQKSNGMLLEEIEDTFCILTNRPATIQREMYRRFHPLITRFTYKYSTTEYLHI